jgi:site-specific DNA-adenine methylase
MFRYPGGKRKLVQLIWDRLRRLHPNGTYCEPFAGGAAVALEVAHWCPGDRIILNDLDPGIAAIWNAVLHHPDELKTAIMNFTPSVEAYREIRTYLTNGGATEGGVETAWRKLAVHQTSYSGKGEASSGFSPLGGYHQRSADRIDQYWNRSALCRKVDQLHNLLIGRTECHAADFEQFLSRPDDCCSTLIRRTTRRAANCICTRSGNRIIGDWRRRCGRCRIAGCYPMTTIP